MRATCRVVSVAQLVVFVEVTRVRQHLGLCADEADTVCDIRALSRKALLAVLEKFPDEEELLD